MPTLLLYGDRGYFLLDGRNIFKMMSEAGCRKALEVQIEGDDLILGVPAKFGLGFGLPGATLPLPNPNIISYYTIVRSGSRNEIEPGKSGFAWYTLV